MKERKDIAPFMKNVVELFANLFILVSADSRCADNSLTHSRQYKCTENYVCCADRETASVTLKLASIFLPPR